jgi:uncharacterized membrane protein YeaQ/YmgE (transglycosylase-associated protein family)
MRGDKKIMELLEMLFFELVMPFIGTLVLGAMIGLVIGFVLKKPRWSLTCGVLGGAVGGWVGVALYRFLYLPSGTPSLTIFSAYVLIGACAGASILALVGSRRNPEP